MIDQFDGIDCLPETREALAGFTARKRELAEQLEDELGFTMDFGLWICIRRLEKYEEHALPQDPVERSHFVPYEVTESIGNILVTGSTGAAGAGIHEMLERLLGTTTSPAYNNANSRIGVGDGNGSVPSPAYADTDLAAVGTSGNFLKNAMNATYPLGPTARVVTFQSDFTNAQANYAWREWGIYNANSNNVGMLNHKGESLGTKVSGTWTLTATITIN